MRRGRARKISHDLDSDNDDDVELNSDVEDDDSIFDITLDRQNMISTLQQNLEIHERNEDYEGCARIAKAIQELEK